MSGIAVPDHVRQLILAAKMDVLVVDHPEAHMAPAPAVGTTTTERTGRETLTRLHLTYGTAEPPMLVLDIAPRDLLVDGPGDALADDARWRLAAYSLELPENAAATSPIPPLDLVIERFRSLDPPHDVELAIDGRPVAAKTITHGRHTIWWCENATARSGIHLYGWDWPTTPSLHTYHINPDHGE